MKKHLVVLLCCTVVSLAQAADEATTNATFNGKLVSEWITLLASTNTIDRIPKELSTNTVKAVASIGTNAVALVLNQQNTLETQPTYCNNTLWLFRQPETSHMAPWLYAHLLEWLASSDPQVRANALGFLPITDSGWNNEIRAAVRKLVVSEAGKQEQRITRTLKKSLVIWEPHKIGLGPNPLP